MVQGQQVQFRVPKVTPAIKVLLIVGVVVFLLQLILEQTAGVNLSFIFGFAPASLLKGWIWQPLTYCFLHGGLFHLLFNLLITWSLGSDLESTWGTKYFLKFYFACVLGAAFCYGLISLTGVSGVGPGSPVIGSSGAVYGLLMAYGVLFGDRILYFFMIFPMSARYFVMILGAIEFVSMVFYSGSGVAHTAHLGGMITGFGVLMLTAYMRSSGRRNAAKAAQAEERARRDRIRKKGSHLSLVDAEEDEDNPKIWH